MRTPAASIPATAAAATTFALALATLGTGCMLQLEAEVPDVEVNKRDVAIDGVPMASLLGEVAMSHTFSQDHPALDLPEGFDTKVRPTKVVLTVKSGSQTLDFMSALRITMRTPGSDDGVELLSYDKPAGTTVGRTLTIPCETDVDVAHLLQEKQSVFDMQVAGRLPEQSWTVDISVHFTAKASYSY